MISVQLPEQDRKFLVKLFELSPDMFKNAAEQASTISVGEKASSVISKVVQGGVLSTDLANVMVKLIFSMGHKVPEKLRELSDGFHLAYTEYKDDNTNVITQEEFFNKFNQLYNCSQPVRLTYLIQETKAGYDKYLIDQEIFTDIKPISLNAGVSNHFTLTHTLKINYTDVKKDSGESKSIYLALDILDVEKLIDSLQKAQLQHKKLITDLSSESFKFIDIKE